MSQLLPPRPRLGRIRHTTAERGTARGSQRPARAGERRGGGRGQGPNPKTPPPPPPPPKSTARTPPRCSPAPNHCFPGCGAGGWDPAMMLRMGKEARPPPGGGQEPAGRGGGGVKWRGGRAGWAPCQLCLPSTLSPALAPGATPCTQPKHQSSPGGATAGSSCQRFLSTAPAAFSGLARALPGPSAPPLHTPVSPPPGPVPAPPPSPGRGNAVPGNGHPELAGGHRAPQDRATAPGMLLVPRGSWISPPPTTTTRCTPPCLWDGRAWSGGMQNPQI